MSRTMGNCHVRFLEEGGGGDAAPLLDKQESPPFKAGSVKGSVISRHSAGAVEARTTRRVDNSMRVTSRGWSSIRR